MSGTECPEGPARRMTQGDLASSHLWSHQQWRSCFRAKPPEERYINKNKKQHYFIQNMSILSIIAANCYHVFSSLSSEERITWIDSCRKTTPSLYIQSKQTSCKYLRDYLIIYILHL